MYRVLIVDDEKLMRDALRAMVSQVDGFQIAACVGSGEEAVEICAREEIHVVFMDIMMPGISGVEASKAIYEQNPSTTIYIISAYSNFAFAQAALSAKVRDYISKPVSFSMIAQLLEGYRQLQSEEENQVRQLRQALENRQYVQLSELVSRTVDKIFLQEGNDKSSIHNRFLQIGREVLGSLDPVGDQEMGIEERFPMNQVFGRESISWMFWLYDVMDYAFRQLAISKCNYMQAVFELLDSKIKENISLVMISQTCNISQSYLSRLFRQNLGISVMDYIHLRKLKHAKMYLAFTDMSMTDIAFRMGYNEGSYFSKVFKKYEGITPQQYKKKVNL